MSVKVVGSPPDNLCIHIWISVVTAMYSFKEPNSAQKDALMTQIQTPGECWEKRILDDCQRHRDHGTLSGGSTVTVFGIVFVFVILFVIVFVIVFGIDFVIVIAFVLVFSIVFVFVFGRH